MIGYYSNPDPPKGYWGEDDKPTVELDFDEREPALVEDKLADRIADGHFHDTHPEPKTL